MPQQQVTEDLQAAKDYVAKLPAANGKVAVIGFCWGGAQTFKFATTGSDLKSSHVFYGAAPTDQVSLKKITAPVLGYYAENDARVNATLEDTKALMKVLKKSYDPQVYTGAGHGFMRSGEAPDANDANKKARNEGWARLVKCLKADR